MGDSITATRVSSKPVTLEEVQEQPDGSKQTVRIDAKRNSWQVDNHGVDRLAIIKAYDGLVKTPEDRKKTRKNRASVSCRQLGSLLEGVPAATAPKFTLRTPFLAFLEKKIAPKLPKPANIA